MTQPLKINDKIKKTLNPDINTFSEEEKNGVYRAIYQRRDIRTYRPDAVDTDKLRRVLDAAHHAPSVGFMQPWNFIMINDADKRRALYEDFLQVNFMASGHYDGDQKQKYLSLKLQGLLDSPVLMLVTCDTLRGGNHVLGRATIPETDVYSTCLAIENLWLSARAEGLGVGWMSLYNPELVKTLFELPEEVVPVALLTLGYPVEFPDDPLLESIGWQKRLPLNDVIFYNKWGKSTSFDLSNTNLNVSAIDVHHVQEEFHGNDIREKVTDRNNDLTKPPGSLGRLEDYLLRLCNIQNKIYPEFKKKQIVLMAGDHGITDEGISAYQPELTAKMMYQFIAGGGAINVFSRQNGIGLTFVDMGVNHDFKNAEGLINAKVARGTKNFLNDAAMTIEQLQEALVNGRNIIRNYCKADILGVGEMGIGNSTSAAALTAAYLQMEPYVVCGSGTGIGENTKNKKADLIKQSLVFHAKNLKDPYEILRCFGGFEIAGITGAILEAYELKIPVVLDGFITGAAALAAYRINPDVTSILFAGHVSKEPGHRYVLKELGLEPILDLNMGLGEGSGAALAMGLLESSARIMREMKTFEESGIYNPLYLPAFE
ncbi:MAG: nicotinate-nucleotide--dimethylbenzimidazole phosphoribosyltransferase [Spirochaetia bacterium]|nr:nicotinate-nucleotide--dimethylbenzimidazole phosphoribosyltransferase [Spirochaetia bacterium]